MTLRATATAGLVALCAAALAGTTGCQSLGLSEDRYEAACAVLVDGSGSARETPRGFDAEGKLETALNDFLVDRECATLAFAPITSTSESSACQAETLELDPDGEPTDDREQLRAAMRAVAEGQSRDLLECARENDPGSDVLGALDRIATSRPGGESAAFHILVVSDFVQVDGGGFKLSRQDLTTAGSRAAVIDGLQDEGRFPRLAGATIYPAGFGMGYRDNPDVYADFEAFWEELLEGRVNADVDFTYRQ